MESVHLVVDALNVIGSRPTGWWRDRESAIKRLVRRLMALAEADEREISVIIDGGPLGGVPEGKHGSLEVVYAPRKGRGAADDRIVEFVEERAKDVAVEVVTADRELIERVQRRGARVSNPGRLLRRLDELDVDAQDGDR